MGHCFQGKKSKFRKIWTHLIGKWKNSLDQKKIVKAVLTDLSKAFDIKNTSYRFSIDAGAFFYLYLKRRNQNVRINNTHSVFQILLFGVP